MRALSGLLLLVLAGLVFAGVIQMRQYHLLTGAELIGWAFVPLAVVLGATWPVRCKVKRTNRKACGRWAYGFLFGCYDVAGHWKEKFLAQLGFLRGETEPIERHQPAGAQVFKHQQVAQSQPLRVTVEDNARSICGFWFGAVSLVLAIAQTVIAIKIH
jgi:apolipoprotein N-acyltransferase